MQATCFKLLQQHGKIDSNLTLKECFRKYIDPNTTDYEDPRIWEHLYKNDVLSIFQFDAASGRRGVLATKPQSLAEMTAVNGLIRLMTPEDGEDQLERFIKNKTDPDRFENEMVSNHVGDEEREKMHKVLDRFQGCAATQESFMILSQELVGFTLKEADALRKTVAKKKMTEIEKQKNLFFEKGRAKGFDDSVIDYLWSVVVAPSLGYGFSENHALPYSMIGCQCILLGGILFPAIYWQTACLLQRSGALDDKSPDYNKIAKAVSLLTKQGVKMQPLDINLSQKEFTLDEESGSIYFGFAGVKGIKAKVIESVFNERPFNSLWDFMNKTKADIGSVVNLIKSGAFDKFADRGDLIEDLAYAKADRKEKLDGKNLLMISRRGYWPTDDPALEEALHWFNFKEYLKLISKDKTSFEGHDPKFFYKVDDRAIEFLEKNNIAGSVEDAFISKAAIKAIVDKKLVPIKNYIKDNQEELLEAVNDDAVKEWKEKYFPSNETFSQWEISTMGLCFGEHPMAHLINLDNFEDLPIEPQISTFYKIKGRQIPLYKLTMIAGIAIAKDKQHHSITLLTSTGPVEVKFRKEQFASYDAQISKVVDGKKKVIEKSWFNRGTNLLIHGMRQDDQFIAKTYKNSPMKHTAYKITKILETGKVEVQMERAKGTAEEAEEEE